MITFALAQTEMRKGFQSSGTVGNEEGRAFQREVVVGSHNQVRQSMITFSLFAKVMRKGFQSSGTPVYESIFIELGGTTANPYKFKCNCK